MRQNKLFTILNKFTKDEMKRFGKFIDSSYHNNCRDFMPLFCLLKKYHPEFESSCLSSEYIYKKLYPGKIYDKEHASVTIRVLFSQMTKLTHKFLVFEEIEKGDVDYTFNNELIKVLQNRDLVNQAFDIALKNSSLLERNKLLHNNYSILISNNSLLSSLSGNLGNDNSFEYERKNLLYIYARFLNDLAQYFNGAFVRKYNKNVDFRGFDLIKTYIKDFEPELFINECEDDDHETKSIALFNYYLLKSRMDENDKESLMHALVLYYRFFDCVSHMFRYNNFTKLYNRFIGRQNLDPEYGIKAIELCSFVWDRNVLNADVNGKLNIFPFINAIKFLSYSHSSSEVNNFFNKYFEMLDPAFKQEAFAFKEALFAFMDRDYEKCLSNISESKPIIHYKSDQYKMRICSLYELGYYEEALYAINTFEQFNRRNKELGNQKKENNAEFIRSIKEIMKLIDTRDSHFIPELIINTNKYTFYGVWFIEKTNQLAENHYSHSHIR